MRRAKGKALVKGYLAFKYITDKERPYLRRFTYSVALALFVKVDGGEGVALTRRRRAVRGRRLWKRRWLELMVTCLMLCSTVPVTGELEALVH